MLCSPALFDPSSIPPRRKFDCCVLKPSKSLKPHIIRRRPPEEAKSGIRPKAEFVISAGDVIRNVDEALQPQRRLVTLLGRHVTLTAATEEVKESRALAEEVPKAVG